MKKMVKESLNETDFDRMYMNKLADASYRRIYKKINKYCKEILDVYDENDEDQYTEGKVEVAQNILEILRNL